MALRVTDGTTSRLIYNNLQIIRSKSERLQQEASTGTKVSAPGDDPVTAQQILQLKTLIASGDQYKRNISTGQAWLSQSETALNEMGNAITRAKEIAIAMANGTYDATSRKNVLNEVKQLKNQLIQLGNTQIAGKYVFGGYVNDTPPFYSAEDQNSDTATGSTTLSNVSIGNLQVGMEVKGAGIPANTTITAITPPSSLTISNAATATATGTSLTFGGNYRGTDDDIMMEVEQGSYIPINFSGGDLLRGGTPAGSTGTDIIGLLDNLTTALNTNDVTSVQASLPTLDDALNQVLSVRSELGSRMNRLESSNTVIDDMKTTLTKVMGDRQDVDIMQVMSDLARQQTAYNAAIAASAKISQISLLDYLK